MHHVGRARARLNLRTSDVLPSNVRMRSVENCWNLWFKAVEEIRRENQVRCVCLTKMYLVGYKPVHWCRSSSISTVFRGRWEIYKIFYVQYMKTVHFGQFPVSKKIFPPNKCSKGVILPILQRPPRS